MSNMFLRRELRYDPVWPLEVKCYPVVFRQLSLNLGMNLLGI